MTKEDTIILVYDNIQENLIVRENLAAVAELMDESNLNGNYIMLGITSFELEVLSIPGIYYLTKLNSYCQYALEIVEMLRGGVSTGEITNHTKKQHKYDDMYVKIRKDKYGRYPYAGLTDAEFEDCITVESLSKEILKEVFREHDISKPLGECWTSCCCFSTDKKQRCKSILNIPKIEVLQHQDEHVKINIIIGSTSYKRIVHEIDDSKEIIEYDMREFVSEEIDREAIEAHIIRLRLKWNV